MTRAMSIFCIQGYNTDAGVLGFIAMPTFMSLLLTWEIRSSISLSECNASMWKQYKSELVLKRWREADLPRLQRIHRPTGQDLRPSYDNRRNFYPSALPCAAKSRQGGPLLYLELHE
jgi:hypothetical protein